MVKAEKHVFFSVLSGAVLVAGLYLALSQVGHSQILQQRAQTEDTAATASATTTATTTNGTAAVAGPTCNGQTKLSYTEARVLNGLCPDIDPGNPGKDVCKDFCTAAENANSDKCKKPDPSKSSLPADYGLYHCETVNKAAGVAMGKCVQGATCANGPAQGYCAPSEGTCCKNPPPPAPAAPPLSSNASGQVAVKPRSTPIAMCNNAKGKCASGCMNYIGECCRSNYPLINNCCQPGCNVYGGTQKAGYTDKTGGKCETPTVQKYGYCRATSVPAGAKNVDPNIPKDPAIFN